MQQDTATTAATDDVWPKRPLAGLLTAQFFGAFNDNAMKLMIALIAGNLAAKGIADASALEQEAARQRETTIAFVVFTLPLMAFSLPSAFLADRISKRTIILAMKFLEILIMAAASTCLFINPVGVIPVLVVLGFMGVQSAIFSPVKYAILPEVLPHSKLSHGNGLLEMWTFLSIILGYAAGGVLLDAAPAPGFAMSVLVVLAVVGFVAALYVPRVAAAGAKVPMREATSGAWRAIISDRALWLTVLGSTFFWTLASLLGQDVLVYAKQVLGVDDAWAGVPFAAFGIGVGVGCVMAGRLSGHRIETGLIPLGAIGLCATTIALGLIVPGFWITMAFMLLLGMSSGFLLVPLEANLQWRAPKERRGAVIALANVPIFGGVLAGSLFADQLSQFGFDSAEIIVVCGVVTLAVTIWAIWLLPVALVRMCLVILTMTLYRLRVVGRENVPEQGGALIVANHSSLVDGLFLIASTDRRVRFLVDSRYFHSPWLKPLMKMLGAIPISGSNQKELLRALKRAGEYLEKGELVCIFAEGEISRTGVMLPFRRGLERILKGRDVPVIPCHLDQVWGSAFSAKGGGFLRSLDGPIPRPVTVSFGAPLAAASASAAAVRRQVTLLDEAAWSLRRAARRPLHHELVSKARRGPFRVALADSSGTCLSRIKALASSIALARALRKHWNDQERVGILLPPSVACGLANFAATLSGRTTVNLNYTAGKAGLEAASRQAGLRTVLTARLFIEKAGIEFPDGVEPIWIEDVRPDIGSGARLLALACAVLAPKRLLERLCGAKRATQIDDIVTIIFSSGSTGEPKGVMLSHGNVDANVEATIQVLGPGKHDRILGVLPQFHAFGYMALWFATNAGMGTVFHNNPVDAAVIGPLVEKYRVTFLIATPTFLQVYMRRCTPGQFGSLRMVMTGAEKLSGKVRDAFQDRFGVVLLEGYGATECSPGIALSTFDYRATGFYQPGRRRGYVGQALPGVAVRAVDPDTFEDLALDTPGMLLVKGPNVMQGYLDRPGLTAAAMHDGSWYITGDIGCIDEDGFIKITDRLARFSKIGGEMIPHGKVEEVLHELAGATEQVFCVTGVPCEKKGEKLAVLHTLDESRIPEIVAGMPGTGLSNLFIPKVEQFVKVEEIPVLGTGKTDLKQVRMIATEALGVGA